MAETPEIVTGAKFNSFSTLSLALSYWEKSNFVCLYKRSSRSITAYSKHASKKTFNTNLKYAQIDYSCIHGGRKFKSESKGLRQRHSLSTRQTDCPFTIKVRVTEDGQNLFVRDMGAADSHNHELSKELFERLPKQRRLNESESSKVEQLLKMKANKKVIQQHLHSSTGKNIILKDIHNIAAKLKKKKKEPRVNPNPRIKKELVIVHHNEEHNHATDEETNNQYPEQRRFSEEERSYAETILRLNMKPQENFQSAGQPIYVKDLHNVRQNVEEKMTANREDITIFCKKNKRMKEEAGLEDTTGVEPPILKEEIKIEDWKNNTKQMSKEDKFKEAMLTLEPIADYLSVLGEREFMKKLDSLQSIYSLWCHGKTPLISPPVSDQTENDESGEETKGDSDNDSTIEELPDERHLFIAKADHIDYMPLEAM